MLMLNVIKRCILHVITSEYMNFYLIKLFNPLRIFFFLFMEFRQIKHRMIPDRNMATSVVSNILSLYFYSIKLFTPLRIYILLVETLDRWSTQSYPKEIWLPFKFFLCLQVLSVYA